MSFTSLEFLVFFPIVLLVYFVIPRRLRVVWLLLSGYAFCLGYGRGAFAALLASTAVTYAAGILLERQGSEGRKKGLLLAVLILHVVFLSFFKYNRWNILLPVGISFYTFQAIAYLADVYQGKAKAERNLLRFALFQSFFPKLVQGPIERSGNLLKQIRNIEKKELWEEERLREGVQLLLWGLFQKLVLADRMAIPVNAVYGQFGAFGGVEILLVTVLYAFQIYMDFAGYTNIARGTAKLCGFDLLENFRRPYLADSVQDFWRRWHMSLSSWLRDYIYIPLGGNRKGKLRKYANVMLTFLISGIWHGTGFHFLAWGLLHGVYQLIDIRKWEMPRWAKRLLTFCLVDAAWMVFRVNSLGDLKGMIYVTLTNFRLQDFVGMELGYFEWGILLLGILLVMAKDILNERGVCLKERLNRQKWPVRVLAYTALTAGIVIFGVYGAAYETTSFLYTQF